jgi:hypothetical protein
MQRAINCSSTLLSTMRAASRAGGNEECRS